MPRLLAAVLPVLATATTFTLVQLLWGIGVSDDSFLAVSLDGFQLNAPSNVMVDGANNISGEQNDNKSLATKTNINKKPLVAVVMAATTKRTAITQYTQTDIARRMLPSLLKTMEPDKYQYSLFVGVDDDDAFWTNSTIHQQLIKHINSKLRDVQVRAFRSIPNRIPFNEILRVAAKAGADYFVRINDDTEFVTPNWTTLGVSALQSLDPPNVGVVGPICNETRKFLLAHDMVHRTHMNIFDNEYYPPVFDNWFLDDWISIVYGPNRTKILDEWQVMHHVIYLGPRGRSSKKTRYAPNHRQREFLKGEIEKGKKKIDTYLQNHTDDDAVAPE